MFDPLGCGEMGPLSSTQKAPTGACCVFAHVYRAKVSRHSDGWLVTVLNCQTEGLGTTVLLKSVLGTAVEDKNGKRLGETRSTNLYCCGTLP